MKPGGEKVEEAESGEAVESGEEVKSDDESLDSRLIVVSVMEETSDSVSVVM